jgi:hypothetical protein
VTRHYHPADPPANHSPVLPTASQVVRTGTPPVSPRDPRRPRRRLLHSLRRAIDRASGLRRNLQPPGQDSKHRIPQGRAQTPKSVLETDREVGTSIGAIAVEPIERARRRVPPGPRLHERASPLGAVCGQRRDNAWCPRTCCVDLPGGESVTVQPSLRSIARTFSFPKPRSVGPSTAPLHPCTGPADLLLPDRGPSPS